MNELDSVLRKFEIMNAMNKLNALLDSQPDALARFDKVADSLTSRILNVLPLPVKLERFKAAVGTEMFTSLAAGPSLNSMLEQWVKEEDIKLFKEFLAAFIKEFPTSGFTEKELTAIILNAGGL